MVDTKCQHATSGRRAPRPIARVGDEYAVERDVVRAGAAHAERAPVVVDLHAGRARRERQCSTVGPRPDRRRSPWSMKSAAAGEPLAKIFAR
jgi:hypothetical protein